MFFFFKQKTAYEMRISDWSSDVCSSDLAGTGLHGNGRFGDRPAGTRDHPRCGARRHRCGRMDQPRLRPRHGIPRDLRLLLASGAASGKSEEHTSELQSLMRISYAVICLKKKNICFYIYKKKLMLRSSFKVCKILSHLTHYSDL